MRIIREQINFIIKRWGAALIPGVGVDLEKFYPLKEDEVHEQDTLRKKSRNSGACISYCIQVKSIKQKSQSSD